MEGVHRMLLLYRDLALPQTACVPSRIIQIISAPSISYVASPKIDAIAACCVNLNLAVEALQPSLRSTLLQYIVEDCTTPFALLVLVSRCSDTSMAFAVRMLHACTAAAQIDLNG